MSSPEDRVDYEAELIRMRDSGEITQIEYMERLNEHRSGMSLEEVQEMNRANVNYGVEGATPDSGQPQEPEPTFNAREHAFRSADFQLQTGGFFGILERGPNALNEFAQNKTLFTLVTQMSRAAANYGQRS